MELTVTCFDDSYTYNPFQKPLWFHCPFFYSTASIQGPNISRAAK